MRRRLTLAIAATALTVAAAGAVTAAAASSTTHRIGQQTVVALNGKAVAASSTAAQLPCTYTNAIPYDRYKGLPPFDPAEAAKPYTAVLATTQGVIAIQMLTTATPCTTNSFKFLAEHDYYDQTHCHRLVTAAIFVLQCGDATGTGSGGPGYVFPDENLSNATYNAGDVAMANAGPNTNGSQFFFCTADNTRLAKDYTTFGHVVYGMDVLRRIAAAGDDSQNANGDGYPNLYVGIRHVWILDGSWNNAMAKQYARS
jgi:peptidyl-prolyl cis-trans isomerase B (cyclophilin B)